MYYVNPAPKKGAPKRRGRFTSSGRGPIVASPYNRARDFPPFIKRKPRGMKLHGKPSRAASSASESTTARKKKKMAKKLYGAAAKAHAKRLGKSKRKTAAAAWRRPSKKVQRARLKAGLGPLSGAAPSGVAYGPTKPRGYGGKAWKKKIRAAKRRAAAASKPKTKKKASGGMSKSTKRSRAAKKAAATRKRNANKRSLSAKKAARTRARGGKAKTHHKRRKHAVAAKSARRRRPKRPKHSTAHRRRRRRSRGGRPSTWKSLRRARRSIRNRRTTARGRAYKRRYHMRSNPGMSDVMAMVKQIVPIAIGLYGGRAASSSLATANIPGLNSLDAKYRGIAMSGVVLVGAHFLTKFIKPLQPYRGGVLIGAGINVLDQALMAFMPAGDAKRLMGLADIYDTALSDYVNVSDYLQVGATPIDDDITLRDYVSVGALQEELGVEEELGLEEELGGALDRAYLGGVSQSSLMKRVPSQPLLAPIPDRSFTREVRNAGAGYDNSDVLYGGIFGGGF
jgi:hypothetical protein